MDNIQDVPLQDYTNCGERMDNMQTSGAHEGTPIVRHQVMGRENTPAENRICRMVEIARILGTGIGIGVGYAGKYHVFAAMVVFFLPGVTGLESFIIGDISARSKGWTVGSPYQKQSACNNLSIAVVMVYLLAAKREDSTLATLVAVVMIFFGTSGMNHLVTEATRQHKTGDINVFSIHFCRIVGALLMIGAMVPVMLKWGALSGEP